MIGDIMRISRLRMGTDGQGVTALVACFDCPLHCKYCINDFCHVKNDYGESVPRTAAAVCICSRGMQACRSGMEAAH